MKQTILFCAILVSFLGFSQERSLINQPPKSVEEIDHYIKAVEIKIESVKSDSIQHEQALRSGWYLEMARNIKAAKRERRILLGAKEEKPEELEEQEKVLPQNPNY